MYNITTLVDTRLGKPTHSRTHGLEYAGPCPWCGGTDRFHVWPQENDIPGVGTLGLFLCMGSKYGRAGCGRSGDMIGYLQQKRGLSFHAACLFLDIDADAIRVYRLQQRDGAHIPTPPAPLRTHELSLAERSLLWRTNALALTHWAHAQMGGAALDYLLERGLTPATISAHQIGYYPAYKWVNARQWDAPHKRILIPRGIVLPWFDEEQTVVCLRFRRLPSDESEEARTFYGVEEKTGAIKRYRALVGSSSHSLYRKETIRPGADAVLLEGELDALILAQAMGKDAAVLATGSTGWGRSARSLRQLARCRRVLVCYDTDANGAGEKAAQYWISHLHNARRWRPFWNDANEMNRDGIDVREWVRVGMEESAGAQRLEVVADAAALAEIATQCCTCGAEVEYYSDQGIASCARHWQEQARPTEEIPTQEPYPVVTCIAPETLVKDVRALAAYLRKAQVTQLALDLETTGLGVHEEKVISLALGTPQRVIVLDLRPYYRFPKEEQARWKEALAALLHLPDVTWIGHNLKFDWSFLQVHFGIRLQQVYDTMLVEHLVHGTGLLPGRVSVSLLETAKRYEIAVTKEQRSWCIDLHQRPGEWDAPFPEEQLAYIVQDIVVPYRVVEQQRPLLTQYTLEEVTHLEHRALPAIAAMEVHGALIDQARWKQVLKGKRARQQVLEQGLVEELGAALRSAQEQMHQAQSARYAAHQQARRAEETRLMHAYAAGTARGKQTWKDFCATGIAAWAEHHPQPEKPKAPQERINLSSSEHLLEALAQIGVHVTSIKEEALEEHAGAHPIIARLLEWRKLSHFCSAFGENLLSFVRADGRIHASFNQVGAISGRIICSGPNLQQIPKKRADEQEEEDIRQCFVAPPGSCLLTADLSNIELRILAEVSDDATMLRFFAEGKDLHAETAKLMFRLPPDTDTKKHLYKGVKVRDIAKTINFGLSYGMGAQGLAQRVEVSVREARDLMHTYFVTYTGVASWLRRTSQEALTQGYAATLAGRKRFFKVDGVDTSRRAAMERTAKNHPIQGTNADILKRALALLHKALPDQVHIILVVHDEIVLECPEDLLEQVKQVLKQVMVQACRDYLKIVHIPEPDVLVGPCWQKD